MSSLQRKNKRCEPSSLAIPSAGFWISTQDINRFHLHRIVQRVIVTDGITLHYIERLALDRAGFSALWDKGKLNLQEIKVWVHLRDAQILGIPILCLDDATNQCLVAMRLVTASGMKYRRNDA